MYHIKKIINNNILCVIDSKGDEFIVTGKGIGFKRHRGEDVEENAIQCLYRKEDKESR